MTAALDLTIFDANRVGALQMQSAFMDLIGMSTKTSDQGIDWTPTPTGSGSMTVAVATAEIARYFLYGNLMFMYYRADLTFGISSDTTIFVPLPSGFEVEDNSTPLQYGDTICFHEDDPNNIGTAFLVDTENAVRVTRADGGSVTLATRTISFSMIVETRPT